MERDPNDPNRVNVVYPPDIINQLLASREYFDLDAERWLNQRPAVRFRVNKNER